MLISINNKFKLYFHLDLQLSLMNVVFAYNKLFRNKEFVNFNVITISIPIVLMAGYCNQESVLCAGMNKFHDL